MGLIYSVSVLFFAFMIFRWKVISIVLALLTAIWL